MDREKVISDLQEQIDWIRDNEFHKFPGWGHTVLAMKDALAMIDTQYKLILELQNLISAGTKMMNGSEVET